MPLARGGSVARVLPRSYTLIVPHQRTTSGGVYVIEQLAAHMARLPGVRMVTLAVRRGPLRVVGGVEVIAAPLLDAGELPQAEVVIGGLAQPDAERVLALPVECGSPLFLFQGYGGIGHARVEELLRDRPRVLAVSRYLLERARAQGCRAELVRPGLDREVFRPGPPCARREPLVAMLTHDDEGKAIEDGLRALARVREAHPDVEVRLFGAPLTREHPYRFDGALSRPEVGELLARAAVLVCSSLEEGLGLPGIEALACGAALASTDTKGCRDYAVHEHTALLSAPGEPRALAGSVIRLLADPDLRGRLANAGRAHVLDTYLPWALAAERFHEASASLLQTPAPTAPPDR